MDPVSFFGRMNALMRGNPPSAADAPIMRRFATIGMVLPNKFDLRTTEIGGIETLKQGARAGLARITREAAKPQGKQISGWDVMYGLGRYDTDYLFRAVIAMIALGANLPEDALYPRATKDADGQALVGSNQYVIRFAKGQVPPVDGFWSLTMYNSRQFFVQNPINRYAIGDRDSLKFESDGSLTLYIQNESPGEDKESNWLPAPKDAFNLFLRLYSPRKEILEGAWQPPAIKRTNLAPVTKVA
jgi:hypothetical protein